MLCEVRGLQGPVGAGEGGTAWWGVAVGGVRLPTVPARAHTGQRPAGLAFLPSALRRAWVGAEPGHRGLW